MRRRLSILTLSVVSLLLLALPAAAVEESSEEVSSGIVGSTEGLALAAVLAVVVGIVVFALSQGGPADETHDDHH